ncbi:MAG: rhomboid family intramembrane serine protease [Chloroflexota bacterium]|nr:MAG: rhomboid family intramembrane serine protease [Chloroflexota bacterium]
MIPLRDHNPSGKVPVVTYTLIALNVLVFLYTFLLPGDLLEEFISAFALTPAVVVQGYGLLTFLTSMFLHGSVGHILGNMLFLNIFGDNLEDRLGHFRYLLYYLACGLGASFLQILVNPHSQVPMLGASGAIAGLMGGYLVLFPQEEIDVLFSFGWTLRQVTVPAYSMLFYWFLAQLLSGVGALGSFDSGGVAYFAHIGGFVTGAALILPFKHQGRIENIRTPL